MNRKKTTSYQFLLGITLLICAYLPAVSADAKAISTIAICTDCKEDTIGVINNQDLVFIDPARYFASIDFIPAWVSGKDKTPQRKKVSCDALSLRFYESVYGANLYRMYHSQLVNGSDLMRGALSGIAKTYEAGSGEHFKAQDELYQMMNLSFATGHSLLSTYKQQGCYASKRSSK